MIFALVAAWLAYKKSKETGRGNPFLMAFLGLGIFVGTQLIFSAGIGVLLALVLGFSGRADDFDSLADSLNIPISIVAIVLSFLTFWIFIKYLGRASNKDNASKPPPPPKFN